MEWLLHGRFFDDQIWKCWGIIPNSYRTCMCSGAFNNKTAILAHLWKLKHCFKQGAWYAVIVWFISQYFSKTLTDNSRTYLLSTLLIANNLYLPVVQQCSHKKYWVSGKISRAITFSYNNLTGHTCYISFCARQRSMELTCRGLLVTSPLTAGIGIINSNIVTAI